MIETNFVFPENKAIKFGLIKNFSKEEGSRWVDFSLLDPLNPTENIITIDKVDYYFTNLQSDGGKNKGGNSIILKLYFTQNIDASNPHYGDADLILKILKFKKQTFGQSKIEKRFKKEVQALIKCKNENSQNVIEIKHFGSCRITDPFKSIEVQYSYYTMEPAFEDLKNFIENNHDSLNIETKVNLCLSLANGINEIRNLGYYHRDIKPDNIFMIDRNTWKIGDLGLIGDQDTLETIDGENEIIGPRGWLSPEAMNKYLCQGKGFDYKYNCKIDHQSDIFQLGKVFWYIFQYNAPIGTVRMSDFQINDSEIFAVIKRMLNNNKERRFNSVQEVIDALKPLEEKILKSAG